MVKMAKKKVLYAKAKRKTAVARAKAEAGKGKIRINKEDLSIIEPEILKKYVEEPLVLYNKPLEYDIMIKVKGGGRVAQLSAARSAIAKILIQIKKDEKLKKKFLEYDRSLLVDDPRRKEPKKPLGRGARARKQMSKR